MHVYHCADEQLHEVAYFSYYLPEFKLHWNKNREGTTKLVKREFVKCFFGFAWLKSASVTGITIDVPQFHNTISQYYFANSSVHNMNSNQTEQWFFFSNCRTNSS